jgi:hypothetical protein
MQERTMNKPTLFDAIESADRKEASLSKLESAGLLALARIVARQLAERWGTVNADHVGHEMKERYDIDSIGPAAGALFRGAEWEFTGQRVLSSRVSNHSREIKVWRLRQ